MTILLLAGSFSIPSRSTRLLHHVGERLAQLGHRYAKLHVLDLPPQALLHADFSNTDIKLAKAQVEQADGVIISTPVYKAALEELVKIDDRARQNVKDVASILSALIGFEPSIVELAASRTPTA
jgi:hypothetical protein